MVLDLYLMFWTYILGFLLQEFAALDTNIFIAVWSSQSIIVMTFACNYKGLLLLTQTYS